MLVRKRKTILKEDIDHEISSIRRQSCIKTVRSRRDNKIRYRSSGTGTGETTEVIAVGPGGVVDGKEVKMEVTVGDKVIYSKYSGTEVKLDGEEYIIVKQSDILAIVK